MLLYAAFGTQIAGEDEDEDEEQLIGVLRMLGAEIPDKNQLPLFGKTAASEASPRPDLPPLTGFDKLGSSRSVPADSGWENRMGRFPLQLELEDGTPANPLTFRSSPGTSWNAGDTIPLGSRRALRVLSNRLDEDLDGDPVQVLVVEPA